MYSGEFFYPGVGGISEDAGYRAARAGNIAEIAEQARRCAVTGSIARGFRDDADHADHAGDADDSDAVSGSRARDFGEFKIIAVTNRHLSPGDYFRRLEKIAASDADAIIVREKDLTEAEYEVFARRAMEICEEAGKECILHTFYEAAARLGCSGIHLPLHAFRESADAADEACFRSRLRPQFSRIGVSVHSPQEAMEAERLGADYVTAGHIFVTDCKKGLAPKGIKFLEETVKSVTIPVYAIGGIHRENIPDVKAVGAAGACIMSQMMNGNWYENGK